MCCTQTCSMFFFLFFQLLQSNGVVSIIYINIKCFLCHVFFSQHCKYYHIYIFFIFSFRFCRSRCSKFSRQRRRKRRFRRANAIKIILVQKVNIIYTIFSRSPFFCRIINDKSLLCH